MVEDMPEGEEDIPWDMVTYSVTENTFKLTILNYKRKYGDHLLITGTWGQLRDKLVLYLISSNPKPLR